MVNGLLRASVSRSRTAVTINTGAVPRDGPQQPVDGRRSRPSGTAGTVDVAVVRGGAGVNLFAHGAAASVEQRRVSAGFFNVLGRPFMGEQAREDRLADRRP